MTKIVSKRDLISLLEQCELLMNNFLTDNESREFKGKKLNLM